ncbi:MAG: hypothetical protein ACI4RF_07200, partial [Eubacterium sp.]
FIYCSTIAFKPMKKSTKCIISSVLTLAVAICLTELVQIRNVSPIVFAVPFLIFCVIVPVLTLIFKKRNLGDELVEKF